MRSNLSAALMFVLATTATGVAQTRVAALDLPPVVPMTEVSRSNSLPDAPSSAAVAEPQANVADKYATIILPGQTATPLHGSEKVAYGFHSAFAPQQLIGITVSAGFSHLIDSQPHYGQNAEAFGKREGAAALRSVVQALATDAVFSPMFHDDPRYYAMGRDQKFMKRVVYAASRVVVTRSSHSMNQRVNAPLLLGYGVAAGLNNAYYPDRDRGAKNTFQNWAGSLGGAALGFEVNEFWDDALRLVHIRR